MKNIFVFASFFFILFMDSCSGPKKPVVADVATVSDSAKSTDQFFLHRWLITAINQKPVTFLGEGKQPELAFTPDRVNRVSGNAGCNNFNGTFELRAENKIKFSPLAATRMSCPTGMENETALFDALSKVDSYSFTEDELNLLSGNSTVVKLRGVDTSTTKFKGIWDLDYISGPRIAFSGLYPDKKPFIAFNFASEEISGSTSCNGFTSKFTIKDSSIRIEDPLKTMIFCEGEGENTFINTMKKVNRYNVKDDVLTLQIDDVAVMRFSKRK